MRRDYPFIENGVRFIKEPHVYHREETFAEDLKNLIQQYYSTRACAYHYLHMLENNYREFINGKDEVSLKKYLYVLRPLSNIMWLRDKQTLVPMSFTETLAGLRIPSDVMGSIDCLLEAKRKMPELGKGSRISKLDKYIVESIADLKTFTQSAPVSKVPIEQLDKLMQSTLKRIWT
jgi:predicted nucleotidyltransferase